MRISDLRLPGKLSQHSLMHQPEQYYSVQCASVSPDAQRVVEARRAFAPSLSNVGLGNFGGYMEQSMENDCGMSEVLRPLKEILCNRPELALQIGDFLFGGTDSLLPDLIEFRGAAAQRTGCLAITAYRTDRLNEFIGTLAASDV